MEEKKESLMIMGERMPIIENAFASIEAMEALCTKILESKLAPDHFYPKIPGTNDRDYTKGNVSACMIVLMQGRQLNLPALTSLQQIIPVNGLLSVKGDAAKSMILGSGKVKPGSWTEVETGSIADEDFVVTFTATRIDSGETLSRSFSVEKAKKAGLWVTAEQLRAQDGWKWKKSAWYKYPERMVKYRALGFLARDLFPDVMNGIYTTEEATDIPVDQSITLETKDGVKIAIPDTDFNKDRSKNLTERASDKIDKKFRDYPLTHSEAFEVKPDEIKIEVKPAGAANLPGEMAVSGTVNIDANNDSVSVQVSQKEHEGEERETTEHSDPDLYTEEELKLMAAEKLLEICEAVDEMRDAVEAIPGKNTNKKLRDIILTYQAGGLDALIEAYPEFIGKIHSGDENEEADPNPAVEYKQENDEPIEPVPPIEPSEEFPLKADPIDAPKLHFEIPELDAEKGARDFADAAKLYGALNTILKPITDNRFIAIANYHPELKVYADKETLCKKAPKEHILLALRINEKLQ